MSKTKYKTFYKKALEDNPDLFEDFKIVHDNYERNPQKYKEEFNKLGSDVVVTLKKVEDKLCHQSEKSNFSKFSNQLADKFWEEVKKSFPKIDEVKTESNAKPAAQVIDDLF